MQTATTKYVNKKLSIIQFHQKAKKNEKYKDLSESENNFPEKNAKHDKNT